MWLKATAFWRSCGNGSLRQVLSSRSSRNPAQRVFESGNTWRGIKLPQPSRCLMCLLRPSGHCADCGKPGCPNDHRTAKCSPVQTRCATSANGTKRTSQSRQLMSALWGRADITCPSRHVGQRCGRPQQRRRAYSAAAYRIGSLGNRTPNRSSEPSSHYSITASARPSSEAEWPAQAGSCHPAS